MDDEEIWMPLVDEPIGDVVTKIQADDPELATLVASPRRQLAFLTFAYIRAGLVLGHLLVDIDVEPEGSRTWVEELLLDPAAYAAVAEEVKAVALEVAGDPKLAEDEPGPGPEARERFLKFTRESLED
ncbi:MAG: hypothetical protein M3377_02850 [Actinomycetota bacterium]|nr:hypothetical protein [Actinomycetota bacterium]